MVNGENENFENTVDKRIDNIRISVCNVNMVPEYVIKYYAHP